LVYEAQGKYDLWLDESEKAATLTKGGADLLAVFRAARLEYARAGYRAATKPTADVLEAIKTGIHRPGKLRWRLRPFLMTRIKVFLA